VLWVPVQGERHVPVGQRLVGSPLLWSPSAEEESDLKFDWEDLAGIIGRGEVDSLTGHVGRYLQVRPKARNARSRRRGTDADGLSVSVMPRGFYLRTAFTRRLLERHYAPVPPAS
jgi:DNA mismatch repair protein MutH